MFLHGLLRAVLLGALCGVLLLLLKRGIAVGGAPRVQGDVITYRMRPGFMVFAYILVALTLLMWCYGIIRAFSAAWRDVILLLVIGSFPMFLASVVLFSRFVLDAAGVHQYRWVLRPLHIGWEQLSHYEVSGASVPNVYFLRPRANGDTIQITKLGFDAENLVRRVVERTSIQQQPYRRRHWYGG